MGEMYPPKEHWELEIITVPVTAGNVAYNLTPTAGYRYFVLSGLIWLDTDATVANRTIFFEKTDGTNVIGIIGRGSTAIVANTIKGVGLGEIRDPDLNWNQVDSGFDVADYTGIDPIILEGAMTIKVTIAAGVAGDEFSGYFCVLKIRR